MPSKSHSSVAHNHSTAPVSKGHVANRDTVLDEPDAAVISTTALYNLDAVVPSYRSAEGDALMDAEAAPPTFRPAASFKPSLKTALPLAVADLTAMTLSFLFTTLATISLTGWTVAPTFVYHYAAVATIYLVVAHLFGLYPGSGMSPPFELRQMVCAVSLTFFTLLVLESVLARLSNAEAAATISGAFLSMLVVPLARFVARIQLAKFSWWGERAIIVGATTQGNAIYRFLKKNPQRGLRPVGLVDDEHHYLEDVAAENEVPPTDILLESGAGESVKYIGEPDDIAELASKHDATWAIVAMGNRPSEEVSRVLTRCSMMPHLLLLPSRAAIPSLWNRAQECGGIAGIHIQDRLLQHWPQILKRTSDVILSAIGLVCLAPVLCFIALCIYIKSPGPVLFGQNRLGRGGRRIKVWKFRSMVVDAEKVLQEKLDSDPVLKEQWEKVVKMKDDPRVIPGIGGFLRKTSLDELPQLWNVLKGDMSLVGPRPIQAYEIARYEQFFPLYCRVRPGVTGVWQVCGRNNTTYTSRVTFDTYYVRNWSLWLDVYVLLRTFRTILLREGAY